MSHSGRRFEQLVCIGRGGFGEVYRATWFRPEGLSLQVALKVLRSDVDPSGQAAARMRDEGRLLSALRHPNIVSVHDMVRVRGRAALVTEYVEGEDLTSIFARSEPLPLRPLVEIVHQVAVAMEAAWLYVGEPGKPGLVHRDIKPSNIRVGTHGQVKLLDFGLARYDEHNREAQTRTGDLLGTTPYMAPERFLRGNDGLASDIFSLGAVLYEGLTGVRWFGDLSLPRILGVIGTAESYQQHVDERMRALPSDLPETLRALLCGMLMYDGDARPDVERLVRETERLADRLPAPGLPRWCKSRDWPETVPLEGVLSGQNVLEEAAETSGLSKRGRRRRMRWNPLEILMLVGVMGSAVVGLWPEPTPSTAEPVAAEVGTPPAVDEREDVEPAFSAPSVDVTPVVEPTPLAPRVKRAPPAPVAEPEPQLWLRGNAVRLHPWRLE